MSMTIDQAKPKLDQTVERLVEELKKLRTGRAATSMLDGVEVEVYGQMTPLKHMSTLTVLDAVTLQISPFDPNNLDAVSAAIRDDQALGLNPADDGKVVRVPIPPMTTERRQNVVKQLHEKVEEANIAMRNIRHEVLNTSKSALKDKDISEEDHKATEKQLNDLLDTFKESVDELASHKEAEIMTV